METQGDKVQRGNKKRPSETSTARGKQPSAAALCQLHPSPNIPNAAPRRSKSSVKERPGSLSIVCDDREGEKTSQERKTPRRWPELTGSPHGFIPRSPSPQFSRCFHLCPRAAPHPPHQREGPTPSPSCLQRSLVLPLLPHAPVSLLFPLIFSSASSFSSSSSSAAALLSEYTLHFTYFLPLSPLIFTLLLYFLISASALFLLWLCLTLLMRLHASLSSLFTSHGNFFFFPCSPSSIGFGVLFLISTSPFLLSSFPLPLQLPRPEVQDNHLC